MAHASSRSKFLNNQPAGVRRLEISLLPSSEAVTENVASSDESSLSKLSYSAAKWRKLVKPKFPPPIRVHERNLVNSDWQLFENLSAVDVFTIIYLEENRRCRILKIKENSPIASYAKREYAIHAT